MSKPVSQDPSAESFSTSEDESGVYLGAGFSQTHYDLTSPNPDPIEHFRLVAFKRFTLALGSEFELSRRIQRAIREIKRILNAERATVYLFDSASNTLWTRLHDGKQAHHLEVPIGSGIVGKVGKRLRTLNIKDAREYAGDDALPDSSTGFITRATLVVPMVSDDGSLIGVVQVLNKNGEEYFSVEDEKLLSTLSQVLGVNIEHARLYTQSQAQLAELEKTRNRLLEKVREQELLYSCMCAVAAALDTTDLAVGIGKLILEQLPYESVIFAFSPTASPAAEVVISSTGSTQKAEIKTPLWLSGTEEEIFAGIEALRMQGLRIRSQRPAILRFPVNDHVQGVLAVFGSELEEQLPSDHRKALSVVMTQFVTGIRQALKLESERKEDRLLTLGRTVSSILHDLRTPMAVIQGFSDLLVRADDKEKREDYSQNIKRQLGRIEGMTQDVLGFARGDVEVFPEKIYLRNFMGTLEQICEMAFQDQSLTFHFETRDRGSARFDEDKMLRVMVNLCRNAAQAMTEGGRCLIHVERVGEHICFRVSDEGVGIPEHLRDKVFETFQSHGKEGGTGLGLSMARRIVEAHGGKMRLDSTVGSGTTIRIVIPESPSPKKAE